jgi:hypothetical protein
MKTEPAARVGLYFSCRSTFQCCAFAHHSVGKGDIRELTAECRAIHSKTDTIKPFVYLDGILAKRRTQARASKRDWNKPEKAGRTSMKIRAHSTVTSRANGSPLGAINAWKVRMLTSTGASIATANGT